MRLIASALYEYVAANIDSSNGSRTFFRLDGFGEDVYKHFLKLVNDADRRIHGVDFWVHSTAPIAGYEEYAVQNGKSATWYRNHVPPDHGLVLLFNRRTSDAQSLKDVFPITESILAAKGIDHLVHAAFTDYQLTESQHDVLKRFLKRLPRVLSQPQLRDLAAFLSKTNDFLAGNPSAEIEEAVAESLPQLGYFRCRELAGVLNTSKGDRLLRGVAEVSRLGTELIDDSDLAKYLSRLDDAEFDDESAYGGPTAEEKRESLRSFLTEVMTDRSSSELVVLQIDWREVSPALYRKSRQTRPERLRELGEELEGSLDAQSIELDDLSDVAQDAIQDLIDGSDPEEEGLDELMDNYGDSLPRRVKTKLRRLRGAKKYQSVDFIAGVTYLGIEILTSLTEETTRPSILQVSFDDRQLENASVKIKEAAAAFCVLYGGLENIMSSVDWRISPLWQLGRGHLSELEDQDEVDESGEREKVITSSLLFQIRVLDEDDNIMQRAELEWRYNSDGPAGASVAHVQAEANLLKREPDDSKTPARPIRIPIYNTSPNASDIGDLDLSRPVRTLGAWYRGSADGGDVRDLLKSELASRARPDAWKAVDTSIEELEKAWAKFIASASRSGVFNIELTELLKVYQSLLDTAATNLRQGQEIRYGFRILTQAWMIGSRFFGEWAVMPFLHPLKLYWWQQRAILFDDFLEKLLKGSSTIVDEKRFRKELTASYSSANLPAILTLPGRNRLPKYFLPVHEVEGYELFRSIDQANLAYGLDPELVTEQESEQATLASANELARVVRDYVETYPFVRDGLEIYLIECRNGTLPGQLVEQLNRIRRRRNWDLRLNVVVHSTDRGAPLYRRITEWLNDNDEYLAEPVQDYFPSTTVKVQEREYDDLIANGDDTDLVLLTDVLAEAGQEIKAQQSELTESNAVPANHLSSKALQTPFERLEVTRDILLTSQDQPSLLRHFYNLQWAAQENSPIIENQLTTFKSQVSLERWEPLLRQLHETFNWVVCYDTTVDRFLLEVSLPNTVEVIRYSLGLGVKRRHNLTVSSSRRAQDIVIQRLTANLKSLLPGTPSDFRGQIARKLVEEAKEVSGDIVLRAAGPGAYLNELIGMVLAKHQTEKRYYQQSPDSLKAWIYLDDFSHWFDKRLPDLLFVAIPPESSDQLALHVELLETKCIGEASFQAESREAQQQVSQGINRLGQALVPGAAHLDADYWYHQFYQAVVGNMSVQREQRFLWKTFYQGMPSGDYRFDLSGHSWVFCYDGSAGVSGLVQERDAPIVAQDVTDVPHRYYHFGRAGLRKLLRELVEDVWQFDAPPDAWSEAYDAPLAGRDVEVPLQEDSKPTSRSAALETELGDDDETPRDGEPTTTGSELEQWIEEKAKNLTRALRNYEIGVYPLNPDEADVGPSIVRFKVRLRPGETLSRIQRVSVDLQRELAVESEPLIENVIGTRFVGVDLPHPSPAPVSLLTYLDELQPEKLGELRFIVGLTPEGQLVKADLAQLRHLLVAGSTGSGKTVFLYTLIVSLIHQFGPDSLSLLLVDPKQTDFVFFEDLPHLLGGEVIVEPETAIASLQTLMNEELPARTHTLKEARARDIRDYNSRVSEKPMSPIVVVIDEYADLVQVLDRSERKEFERQLIRLAQRARSVGIHLVVATQRPSADIVSTNLKANLPARIAFRLPSHHDSATILDQSGAQNLLGKGDMLFRHEDIIRVQAPFIDVEALVEYLSRYH